MKKSLDEQDAELSKLLFPIPAEFLMAGMELEQRERKEDSLGPSVWYRFSNSTSHVKLTLSVSEYGIGVISISRSEKEYFVLEEYLKHHGRIEEAERLFYLSRDLPAFLEYLRKMISGEWLDIFLGKRWEDIPRDWMGYR
jgi:hypothetical protein